MLNLYFFHELIFHHTCCFAYFDQTKTNLAAKCEFVFHYFLSLMIEKKKYIFCFLYLVASSPLNNNQAINLVQCNIRLYELVVQLLVNGIELN